MVTLGAVPGGHCRKEGRYRRFDSLLCSLNLDHQAQLTRSRETRCDSCTRITPSYDIVNYGSIEGGYRHLCSQCFNKEVAEAAGLTGFENAKFEPVGLVDSTGEAHEFHFRVHLFGTGVALDAFELCDGHPAGYQWFVSKYPQEFENCSEDGEIKKMQQQRLSDWDFPKICQFLGYAEIAGEANHSLKPDGSRAGVPNS